MQLLNFEITIYKQCIYTFNIVYIIAVLYAF